MSVLPPAISSSIFLRASEISSRFTVSTLTGSGFAVFAVLRLGWAVTVLGSFAAVSLADVCSAAGRAAGAFSGCSGVFIIVSTSDSTEPCEESGADSGGVR